MTTTEFRSQADCVQASKALTGSFERVANGRKVVVETKARCLPDDAAEVEPQAYPVPEPRRGASIPPVVIDNAPPSVYGTLPRPVDTPMFIAPPRRHSGPEPWPQ